MAKYTQKRKLLKVKSRKNNKTGKRLKRRVKKLVVKGGTPRETEQYINQHPLKINDTLKDINDNKAVITNIDGNKVEFNILTNQTNQEPGIYFDENPRVSPVTMDIILKSLDEKKITINT